MGMDVYGNKPTAPEGEYFRRTVWGWHPLAELCVRLAPEECRRCKYWHTNDGAGLSARDAVRLAERLDELVRNGSIAEYIARRDARLAALPDEECSCCKDTDKAIDSCAQCHGRGKRRPSDTWYRLDQDDVTELLAFLKACGGFKIY